MRSAADLGTVLGVWAHPDDEAYLTAGMMAHARDAGNRVVVTTATYGELGTSDPQGWPRERLAPLRAKELAASLAAVGVCEHRVLGFDDGGLGGIPPRAGAAAVAAIIEEVAPDTIVTFGPDGLTGHDDHKAISAWTTAAWRAMGQAVDLLYATLTPDWHDRWGALNQRVGLWLSGSGPVTPTPELALTVHCDLHTGDRKHAALRAHASQTTPLIELVGEMVFREWWSREFFAAA